MYVNKMCVLILHLRMLSECVHNIIDHEYCFSKIIYQIIIYQLF